MNTHTKGPWRVAHHRPGLVKVECGDKVVCDCLSNDANARLIAASPELLRELTRVVSWFEQFQVGGDMLETLPNVDLRDAKATCA